MIEAIAKGINVAHQRVTIQEFKDASSRRQPKPEHHTLKYITYVDQIREHKYTMHLTPVSQKRKIAHDARNTSDMAAIKYEVVRGMATVMTFRIAALRSRENDMPLLAAGEQRQKSTAMKITL
jgi:hypothetical protein